MIRASVYEKKQTGLGTWLKVFVPNVQAEDVGEHVGIEPSLISRKQNGLIHALISEIAVYSEATKAEAKESLKEAFAVGSVAALSMSQANDFIDFIIDATLYHDIPISDKVRLLAKETNNYLYSCIRRRKCCICGKPGEVYNLPKSAISLCERHQQERLQVGEWQFDRKYHVEGINLKKWEE